jgi:SAM-dependent methyltransferase
LDGIDIYLLDQVLRGRIVPGARIIDAGCGGGRNLQFFLQAGYDVRALDADPAAVAATRTMAARLAPHLDADRFRVESIGETSFADASADVVISSAVLHFAADDDDFMRMVDGSWRLLVPGGLFFARLASSIGIERQVRPLVPGSRRCRLPDGSDRYLVDEAMLLHLTETLGGRLLDPIKTTVVQDQRAMTTWVATRTAQGSKLRA